MTQLEGLLFIATVGVSYFLGYIVGWMFAMRSKALHDGDGR